MDGNISAIVVPPPPSDSSLMVPQIPDSTPPLPPPTQNGVNANGALPPAPIQVTNTQAGVPQPAATAHLPSEALVAMPVLPQAGPIIVGPGAKKEAQLLGLGLVKLRSKQKDWLADAKKYAKEQSIKQVLLRQTVAHQQNQQKVAMYAQALSLMARVYIGSISFEVREEMIKNSFSVFGPIKSINMSWDAVTGHHKGFAFLEYEIPEAALLAQESMNGVLMGGRNLKVNVLVGRPSNMPQAQPIIEMVMQEAKAYHRVYVASVHPDLSESDLKSVFEAFGEVTKCQLARATGPNAGSGHRGFGYIEFGNAASAAEAIAGMNMFDLGGQYLRVGKCITPPDALTYIVPTSSINLPTAAAVAAAEVTAKIQAQEVAAGHSPLHTVSSASKISSMAGPSSIPPIGVASVPPVGIANVPPVGVAVIPPVGVAAIPPVGIATIPPTIATPSYSSPLGSPVPAPMSPSVSSTTYPSTPPQVVSYPPMPAGTPPPPPMSVPAPVVTAPPVPPAPTTSRRGFGGFAPQAPPVQVVNIPPPQVVATPPPPLSAIPTPPRTELSSIPPPPPPVIASTPSLISRINIGTATKNCSVEPATFAPLPANIAPVDRKPSTGKASSSGQLAIGAGSAAVNEKDSMALMLADSSIPGKRDLQKTSSSSSKDKSKSDDRSQHKKKKNKKPTSSAPKGPQLNTPQALEAASRAGELNDQMAAQNANSEDVSLASQEGLEIRGNDARHLLMHKLMRTNRSTVIVLKNMVTIEECDDELEGEIRDECTKYGQVEEVVIAQDPTNGSVKIFVRFGDIQEAEVARQALDKRYFAGKEISAQSYDQILFDHNDYTG
uniref:RRM domain-containing protein n=3 Tax=Parascaris TaxID=6254 RepID=A0A914ZQ49_PARUN